MSLAVRSGSGFRSVFWYVFFKRCLCFISFIREMGNRLFTLLLLLGLLAPTAWISKCCRRRSQSTRLSARLLRWRETGSWNWSLCCRKGSGWFCPCPLWDAVIKEQLRQSGMLYSATVKLALNRGVWNYSAQFHCLLDDSFFNILLEQSAEKNGVIFKLATLR